MPDEHPAYLHAIADLRHARAHLERPGHVTMRTAWNEAVATGEIDAALHEIKAAAIDDGKSLNDHPPVDVGLDWPGRLHRSLELLRNARHDCEQAEDNGSVQGLRERAILHIDAAIHHIEKGIADNFPHSKPPPPIAVIFVAPPRPAAAAMPPPAGTEHPAYLHAIADLRHSRAHLERVGHVTMRTAWNEAVAIGEIDAALHEIKAAAIDDGKSLSDHPPVDLGLDWPGRLHRSLELLRNARHDCEQAEDNGSVQGLRERAILHIDAAIHHIEKGIADNFPHSKPPPPIAVAYVAPPRPAPAAAPAPAPTGKDHPAYLHALVDLRHARAHLERPAKVKMRTAWDETVAIAQIDAAIHEIKDAAIDDGKNLADHPPVSAKLAWPGRLHKTVALLKQARKDIAKEEDNGFARGLQGRAYEHIDAAIAFVQKGIKDNPF
jgi:hypothetical protein